MTDTADEAIVDLSKTLQLDARLLRVGAILVGVGGVVGFAGMMVGGSAVAAVARQWVRQLEQPPSQIAKQKWQQLVAAGSAGADVWKQGAPTATPDP